MAGRAHYRVQSASALMALLVALAGIVAASATLEGVATGGALMRRSLATSDASVACVAEGATCLADDSCVECMTTWTEKTDECADDLEAVCEDVRETVCCALSDETDECYNSVVFANFLGR